MGHQLNTTKVAWDINKWTFSNLTSLVTLTCTGNYLQNLIALAGAIKFFILLFLLLIILTVTRNIDESEISQICVFQNNTTPPRARGSQTIVRKSRALSHHTLFL